MQPKKIKRCFFRVPCSALLWFLAISLAIHAYSSNARAQTDQGITTQTVRLKSNSNFGCKFVSSKTALVSLRQKTFGKVLSFGPVEVRLKDLISSLKHRVQLLKKQLREKPSTNAERITQRKRRAALKALLAKHDAKRELLNEIVLCQRNKLPPVCGNAVLELNEQCDDGNTQDGDCCAANCKLDAVGSSCGGAQNSCAPQSCNASGQCVVNQILSCSNNDGCCAAGCNSTNDNDCKVVCGNSVVELGETCDGNCVSSCSAQGCNLQALKGTVSACDAACASSGTQTSCINNDSCCPSGCNSLNDNDCAPGCGNSILEAGELCDGNCPSSCPQIGCNLRSLSGSSASCNAQCVDSGIQTSCINADGCCPSGCNALNDSDCSAVCGNGVVEPGETCDGARSCSCPAPANSCFGPSSGSAASCNVVCNPPVLSCSGKTADKCCPLASADGAQCGNGNDADCAGVNWRSKFFQFVTLDKGIPCQDVNIYGVEPGASYSVTSCYPLGEFQGVGDVSIATIEEVGLKGPLPINAINDDCSNASALPRRANWSCNTLESPSLNRAFCSGNNSGGFTLSSSLIYYLHVRVCLTASSSSAVVPIYIWYNSKGAPNLG